MQSALQERTYDEFETLAVFMFGHFSFQKTNTSRQSQDWKARRRTVVLIFIMKYDRRRLCVVLVAVTVCTIALYLVDSYYFRQITTNIRHQQASSKQVASKKKRRNKAKIVLASTWSWIGLYWGERWTWRRCTATIVIFISCINEYSEILKNWGPRFQAWQYTVESNSEIKSTRPQDERNSGFHLHQSVHETLTRKLTKYSSVVDFCSVPIFADAWGVSCLRD